MKTYNETTLQQISASNQEAKHNIALSLTRTGDITLENTTAYIGSVDLPEIGYKSDILLPASKDATSFVTKNNKTIPTKITLEKSVNLSSKVSISKQVINQSSDADFIETQLPQSTTADKTVLDKSLTDSSNGELAQAYINKTKQKKVKIKRGDTLSGIFKRLSLSSKTLHEIMKSGPDARRLTRIKPGKEITFTLDNDNQFVAISYPIDKIDTLMVNKEENSFVTHISSKEVEIQQQFASASINASLFAAGNQAGLSNSMIMKLAQLFGWDIDFVLDIRKGDSFSLVYEEKFVNGKKISEGDILAAEFINQGKSFYAVRYTDASGRTDFYSDKGYSMRKAFLRTPVEFSRISSKFSSGRKHPVLNRIRAHKGVDYAASRGTPVKAAGKGKVIFKGKKGGYGRVIILQHGSKYTTLYAHLNTYNKKIRNGSRVKQGQVIGYVGSSGLATGPHLHYEFRVNGVHRNPLTVPLPDAAPLAKKYRPDFEVIAENMISQIKSRKQSAIALKSE